MESDVNNLSYLEMCVNKYIYILLLPFIYINKNFYEIKVDFLTFARRNSAIYDIYIAEFFLFYEN